MKALNVPIPEKLKEDLDSFAKENGIHKKKIVELALLQYMRSFSARAIHTRHE